MINIIRKSLNWYARLAPARGKSVPPHEHVVQIGDPTLRRVSSPVPLEQIKTKEIQTVIKKLYHVINKYDSVGMAAPQIGVNLRIFAMILSAKEISRMPKELVRNQGVCEVPFTVFINPELKVMDNQKLIFDEGCESMRGYSADVARYKTVQISGYNSEGEPMTKVYTDGTARIAQHEIDHLDGKLYVDVMEKKSLQCTCWEEVNMSKGKVTLPFTP